MVDGKKVKGDNLRATGLCINAALCIDQKLGDMGLTDSIGGAASS